MLIFEWGQVEEESKRRCCAKLVAKLKLQVDFSFDFHSLVRSLLFSSLP